jgi:hypothetical protein
MPGYEVRRAPIGPGLRPGPCRQARWGGRGLRGQGWALAPIALATRRRRALDAGGAAPDNARRSTWWPRPLSGDKCTWREGDGLVCRWRARHRGGTAGTASGRSPGSRARQPPRPQGPRPKDAAKAAAPRRRSPGEPWPPTAGHPGRFALSLDCSCPSPAVHDQAVRPGAPQVRP